MTEELKLDLMKKFKELNVAEYTTKDGDYYGLMFAGADIATKELQEEIFKLEAKVRTLEIEQKYCLPNCSKIADLERENAELKERIKELTIHDTNTVLKGLEMGVLKNSHRDRANNLQEQLTKAKELLAKWVELFKPKGGNIPPTPIQIATEQFLAGDV